ncbi:polysaccharide deacetylase family protein [Natribacillus halophilus]|uniref:Peptidoglycan/xylan/chitin deacetylase, PgdA/CDA1 family n=1 Tax=Natribacillus halophilus TaxID=549003 RepID=A0A1G8J407_9BACI|nr:polysaccharide deacetylase family protein [Natribacillus halophilus]SDI25954.1 Peptidoglycan/xylan/chitin deacetylase, PgdA/CDA1 family [Natribacillus halophilus]
MRKKLPMFFLTQLLLTDLVVGCNNVAEDPGTTGDEGQGPAEDTEEPSPEEYPLDEDEINTVQYDTTPEMQGGSERDVRDPNPVSNVELHNTFPDIVTLQGPSEERNVALTFDDGPDDVVTPAVLDKLNEYDIEATFFLIGERVEAHPEVVERILDEGHVVANHSWNHPEFPEISYEDAEQQINRTETALQDVTGEEVRLFRPPYGAQTEDHVQIMDELDYSNIIWSQDSLDWKDLEVEEVADNILSDISYGAIVLQHSAGLEGDEGLMVTVDALDKVIPALQEDDVEFVTVDELLDIPAYR